MAVQLLLELNVSKTLATGLATQNGIPNYENGVVETECLKLIRLQLEALGLISMHHSGIVLFWRLTPKGKAALAWQ